MGRAAPPTRGRARRGRTSRSRRRAGRSSRRSTRRKRRDLVVRLGLHGAAPRASAAVGPDHHPGALGDGPPPCWPRMPVTRPSSTRISSTVKPSRTSAPAAAAASTSSASSTVRRGPYAVAVPVGRARGPRDRDGPEVERVGRDRRAAGRLQPLEQAPPLERGHAGRMHEMRRHRVAGERGPVHEQNAMAVAGQQHRRRRSGAARSDDDRVVCGAHGATLRARGAPPTIGSSPHAVSPCCMANSAAAARVETPIFA